MYEVLINVDLRKGYIICSLILYCKKLFLQFKSVATKSRDNNFTIVQGFSSY